EELTAAEPHAAGRQSHLDCTGRNKEHGVSPVPPADDALVWHGEAWPQQPGDALQLALVEAGENIQPLDQAMRIQTDLEARPPFGRTAAGGASLQVVIQLLRDQSFFEQGLVPAHFLP